MDTTLRHPARLIARVALLGPVVAVGLHECAEDLLSCAALDLLAEQARSTGRPELALRHAMNSASLRLVLASIAGADAVENCLDALRLRDLDILAAHVCSIIQAEASQASKPARLPRHAKIASAA